MKIIIILSLMAAVAHGQHAHSCIHNNHQEIQATQVVSNVVKDVDTSGDGFVQNSELSAFLALFDEDKSGHVMEDEFVKAWHHRYHDVHDFAGYLFHHFDRDMDHEMTLSDMFAMGSEIDTNGDNMASADELRVWLIDLYHNCVHHPH